MCCLFVMADTQATAYWAVVRWITLQTPLQESEGRAGLMPSYSHGTGGDLSFPVIQEKIQPGASNCIITACSEIFICPHHKIFRAH